MEIYRRVVRVFIGSPSDVRKERQYFRDVIAEVNNSTANFMRVQIDPIGWEDILPGKGRPQEKINEDVKDL